MCLSVVNDSVPGGHRGLSGRCKGEARTPDGGRPRRPARSNGADVSLPVVIGRVAA